jgi:hypothetical protein
MNKTEKPKADPAAKDKTKESSKSLKKKGDGEAAAKGNKPGETSNKLSSQEGSSNPAAEKSLRPPKAMCVMHEIELTYLCNTCDELACQKCIQEGPHNTSGHVLMKIDTAYKIRKGIIENNMNGPMAKKSSVLEHKMSILNFQIEKVRSSTSFILRDTKVYFEKMIDTLKYTFKTEISDYVGRIEYYESEVREINGLINYFNLYLNPDTHFDFLVVYPKLKSRFDDLEERKHGRFEAEPRRRQEVRLEGSCSPSRSP